MSVADQHAPSALTDSQGDWLRARAYLREYRYELALSAADEYADTVKVADTSLLSTASWIPAEPLPLDHIRLDLDPSPGFAGLTGGEAVTESVRPVRPDGTRYPSYAAAMGDLAAPTVFEDRSTYRLLEADLAQAPGRLRFGKGSYFDGINVGEAAAHEYATVQLGDHRAEPLRDAVGDPIDPSVRPVNVAISTMTIRHDRNSGQASFLLHWRDPARVGHAGGLYQVLPVGIFQPSGEKHWNERNDFSLWRCMVREYAEELLGESEDHGSDHHSPIDYETWPFAARMATAYRAGQLRAYCLGLGVDPLTFATDLLTVTVFDAELFDELFDGLVAGNAEGRLVTHNAGAASSFGFPFTRDEVDRLSHREPMQAAGAALLQLAWRDRRIVLA